MLESTTGGKKKLRKQNERKIFVKKPVNHDDIKLLFTINTARQAGGRNCCKIFRTLLCGRLSSI